MYLNSRSRHQLSIKSLLLQIIKHVQRLSVYSTRSYFLYYIQRHGVTILTCTYLNCFYQLCQNQQRNY